MYFFTSSSNESQYAHVSSKDELDNDDYSLPTIETNTPRGIPLWIFLACIGCTLLNLYLVRSTFSSTSSSNTKPSTLEILRDLHRTGQLPRPNQYIGLDRVNRTQYRSPSPSPLINYPPILTQVSSDNTDFVFPDDTHRWLSWWGSVAPDDRHFFVNKTTNTIAQFRVHDFGMSSCQIVINIPPQAVIDTITPAFEDQPGDEKVYTIQPSLVSVDIWRLEATKGLDVKSLSYNNRPPRDRLVETVNVEVGKRAETKRFACPDDTLQTFEFTCGSGSGEGCEVDFWQDKREPLFAAVMIQHSTMD